MVFIGGNMIQFIIGLLIGFVGGSIVGVVLTSIMASSSRDSFERELLAKNEEIEK